MQGYVYALINPVLKGLVKVGKTSRDPEDRAKELSSATGVPMPFVVAFSVRVSNCHAAEAYAHELLAQRGYRLCDNREFFNAPLSEIVKILSICESENPLEQERSQSDEECTSQVPEIIALVSQGRAMANGENGEFQNHRKAEKILLSAAKLGSSEAFYELGLIYNAAESCLFDHEKSNDAFSNAIMRGHEEFDCLCQLFSNFIAQEKWKNAAIAANRIFNECDLYDAVSDYIYYNGRDAAQLKNEIIIDEQGDDCLVNFGDSLGRLSRELKGYSSGLSLDEIIEKNEGKVAALLAVAVYYFLFLGHKKVSFIESDFLASILSLVIRAAEHMLTDSSMAKFEDGIRAFKALSQGNPSE